MKNPSSALLIACLLFSPLAAQKKDPAIEQYRTFAQQNGDAKQGKEVFNSKKAKCSICHAVGGTERKAGPDLLGIADKFKRPELINHVLEPSATILADYATTVIVTGAGKPVSGILRKRNDREVQLITNEGKLLRIKLDNIESEKKSKTSLMPQDFHKELTKQQFGDVIAYLITLRHPGGGKTTAAIPELREPIRFVPFHEREHDFKLPVWFSAVPGTKDKFVIAEQQTAKVWLLHKHPDGDRKTVFVDLDDEVSDGKFEGVIGFAFHPNFIRNGKYYVDHNIRGKKKEFSTVVIERVANKTRTADSGKPTRRLIHIKQNTDVHCGGMVGFGPDGYLYIGTGDGGPQKDPEGHGQNTDLLNGKVLRIDVNRRDPGLQYAIPKSNPFYGRKDKTRREIFAYGFRQAWRFSWDPITKEMWAGDVGQNLFEEVAIIRVGENHGWNVYEGFSNFSNKYRVKGRKFVPPVFAYSRKLGASVTGGYVYRGTRSPSYYGAYIFGDYESKRIWAMKANKGRVSKVRQIGTSPQKIVSFGVDSDGEIYLVGYEGTVYRLDLSDSVFE